MKECDKCIEMNYHVLGCFAIMIFSIQSGPDEEKKKTIMSMDMINFEILFSSYEFYYEIFL